MVEVVELQQVPEQEQQEQLAQGGTRWRSSNQRGVPSSDKGANHVRITLCGRSSPMFLLTSRADGRMPAG